MCRAIPSLRDGAIAVGYVKRHGKRCYGKGGSNSTFTSFLVAQQWQVLDDTIGHDSVKETRAHGCVCRLRVRQF